MSEVAWPRARGRCVRLQAKISQPRSAKVIGIGARWVRLESVRDIGAPVGPTLTEVRLLSTVREM